MIERIEARELEQQINAEIDLLPEKCRNVFILSRKEYLSNKEIAQRLNISESAVEQHIRKTTRRLRASLATIIELEVLWFFINK